LASRTAAATIPVPVSAALPLHGVFKPGTYFAARCQFCFGREIPLPSSIIRQGSSIGVSVRYLLGWIHSIPFILSSLYVASALLCHGFDAKETRQ
jgi:hypothetical protein